MVRWMSRVIGVWVESSTDQGSTMVILVFYRVQSTAVQCVHTIGEYTVLQYSW